MDEKEVLNVTPQHRQKSWSVRVWDACGGKCSNCGSKDNLKVRMIVPKDAGGKEVVSNGTLLCRTCEFAREISQRVPQPASGEHTRPINFFVSRNLHKKLKNGLAERHGFRSVSALIRYLMSKYVTDTGQFKDLRMYQEPGGSEVKVNVWVGRDMYDRFKALADSQGVTVTETLRSLIRMYETESLRIVGRAKR